MHTQWRQIEHLGDVVEVAVTFSTLNRKNKEVLKNEVNR